MLTPKEINKKINTKSVDKGEKKAPTGKVEELRLLGEMYKENLLLKKIVAGFLSIKC